MSNFIIDYIFRANHPIILDSLILASSLIRLELVVHSSNVLKMFVLFILHSILCQNVERALPEGNIRGIRRTKKLVDGSKITVWVRLICRTFV